SSTCVSERWGRNREEAELRHYTGAAARNSQPQPGPFSSAKQDRVSQSRKDAKREKLRTDSGILPGVTRGCVPHFVGCVQEALRRRRPGPQLELLWHRSPDLCRGAQVRRPVPQDELLVS